MQSYHTQTTIASNGLPILQNLPFNEGEFVEVTIESKNGNGQKQIERKFPYRGKEPFYFLNPLESAFQESEWEMLSDDPS